MRVARCPEVSRELKSLCKNRPFVLDAVKQFERLLTVGMVPQGDAYANLGLRRGGASASIYKFKIPVPKSAGGKLSGLRYVCEFLGYGNETWVLYLGIYMDVGQDSERQRREDYRHRFDDFELDDLEHWEEFYP